MKLEIWKSSCCYDDAIKLYFYRHILWKPVTYGILHDLCSTDLQWCFMLFKQLPSLTPDVVVCWRCAGFCDTTDSRPRVQTQWFVMHWVMICRHLWHGFTLECNMVPLQSYSKREGRWAKQKHLICFSVVHLVHLLLALGERQHLSHKHP